MLDAGGGHVVRGGHGGGVWRGGHGGVVRGNPFLGRGGREGLLGASLLSASFISANSCSLSAFCVAICSLKEQEMFDSSSMSFRRFVRIFSRS